MIICIPFKCSHYLNRIEKCPDHGIGCNICEYQINKNIRIKLNFTKNSLADYYNLFGKHRVLLDMYADAQIYNYTKEK